MGESGEIFRRQGGLILVRGQPLETKGSTHAQWQSSRYRRRFTTHRRLFSAHRASPTYYAAGPLTPPKRTRAISRRLDVRFNLSLPFNLHAIMHSA